MPIQMVCDSTPSLVSAAIRVALHPTATTNGCLSAVSGMHYNGVSGNSVTTNGSSNNSAGVTSNSQQNKQHFRRSTCYSDVENNDNPEEGSDDLVEFISQSLRQGQQVKPITYEEGPSYNTSLEKLKSKYILLKAAPSDVSSENQNNLNTDAKGSSSGTGGPMLHVSKVSSNASGSTGSSPVTNGSMKQFINAARTTSTNLQNGVTSATASPAPASGKETATLPTPKRTLFPREHVQVGWKTTGRKWHVGAGMINMGNTCYLNSTLQALFHVPAIANWLLSDVQHRERCDDGGSGGSCIICAMAKTLLESQGNQSTIRPHLVYTKLRLVCKHLVPGRQEDAHEFLRYLMEAMEKSYLGRFKNSKELDQYSKETTPLNQILGGYLRSEVKCLSCQHISTTFQHFEDVLLDIRKANSIDEALEVYFARERLEEMGYKCEACKRRVAATKQFSLERAPFALCVQLKRFSMLGGKINKHVELRPRLDLTPYSSPALKGANGKLVYRLTSMVTHLGSTQHCGHYTAIGLTDSGGYHVFDDSSVRPIGTHNVMSTNAYILFYELECPAGSIMLPNGVCRTKPNAAGGQPSSTATLASIGHISNDGAASGSPSAVAGGSNGTAEKATNSSPLRVLGSGGSNGTSGGFLPSKLEQKSGFIGPVLPTAAPHTAKSTNSSPMTTSTGTPTNGKISAGQATPSSVSSLAERHPTTEGTGSKPVDSLSSPSSTSSTLSNVSPLSSPVKHQSLILSASSSQDHQSTSKTQKVPPTSSSDTGANNGSVMVGGTQKLNGLRDDKKCSPLLPSMPKLWLASSASSGNKTPQVNGSSKSITATNAASSVVSLVPYDTDDNSDDCSSADEKAGKKPGAPSANGMKRTKPAFVQNGVKTAKMDNKFEPCDKQGESRSIDGTKEERGSATADERAEMAASRSPQMIKTKTGLWKVSRSSNSDQLSFPDSSSSNGGSASSSKASSPATSCGSSPASSSGQQARLAQQHQQPSSHHRNGVVDDVGGSQLTNGFRSNHPALQQQCNGVGEKRKPTLNGFHQGMGQSNGDGGKSHTTSNSVEGAGAGAAGAVQTLLKMSHRGYGAQVKSWNGQETTMDRELAQERREERKRQFEDDREMEMDRGRIKKSKTVGNGVGSSLNGSSSTSGNAFQVYQNHHNGNGGAKWHGNGNRNGSQYNHYQQNNHRGNYHQNGNGQRHHGGGGGFRNGGRRFGARNGGGYQSKAHYHHGSVASSGGNNGSNGFYHR